MLSIVAVENGAGESTLQRILNGIREAGQSCELILIGSNADLQSQADIFIPAGSRGLAELLTQVVNTASNEKLVFIDGRCSPSIAQLQQLICDIEDKTIDAAAYAPLQIGNDQVELNELSIDTLVTTISRTTAWPLLMVATSKSFLAEQEENLLTNSLGETLARIIVSAVANSRELIRLNTAAIIETGLSVDDLCALSGNELAGILSYAVNNCNIEDLFPNHAWSQHQEESAAACYHTLAAQFLRFGDTESARECLAFSDKLEDSPRSLALRALISLDRGETFGAVANLVSSLQQYELRKRNENGEHYLTFSPVNIEIVNSALHKGLEALNQKDNAGALEHFAAAVFNFDDFYTENGVDRLVH